MQKSKHIHPENGNPWGASVPIVARLIGAKGRAGLLLFVSLLTACAGTTPVDVAVPRAPAESSASAAALMARAARAPADRAAALYLKAAWAYLEEPVAARAATDAPEPSAAEQPELPASTAETPSPERFPGSDYAAAERAFALIEPGWLDAELLPDYQLLTAALAIHRADLATARAAMAQVPFEYRRSARALRNAGALCEAEADYRCAVRNSVAAAGDDPAANEKIWSLLNRSLSLSDSKPHRQSNDPALKHLPGWLSLQNAVVAPFSLAESRRAAGNWLSQHPEHPAALIPPAAISRLLADEASLTRVALLLPLSGPLARAGESIRDGFISASLSAGAADRLTVTIYDSAAEPIPVLYERILADDADLIVGPLQKPAITALNELNPDLPVLALNYLDEGTRPTAAFNQFGLAIEDEARTIARRLQADGVSRALLFHNYDDWSLRARRTLTERQDGGDLDLTVQPFTDLRTITESVGSAMHVAGSQTRRDELARLLGEELEFLPRAREDVDAVIALIDNTEANALVPALRFHFANHLPIYASSQTTRRARAGQLEELSGFHVSELPYFLAGNPVYAELADPFELADNPFASLLAMGSDAYRLAERLSLDNELVLLGSTGLLRREADGRIVRELAWGTIIAGRVQGSAHVAGDTGAGD